MEGCYEVCERVAVRERVGKGVCELWGGGGGYEACEEVVVR